METKIDTLTRRMEQSRLRLIAALDKVAPQAEIYPAWKLKQVLDHITGWDELVVEALSAYKKGEPPAFKIKGINQFNAESVAKRKTMTLEQSRQAFQSARQQVLEIMRGLPAEMLAQKYDAPWGGKCTISSIVKIFVSHEDEHARQIEDVITG
jgi:hypothetical protein